MDQVPLCVLFMYIQTGAVPLHCLMTLVHRNAAMVFGTAPTGVWWFARGGDGRVVRWVKAS